MPPIPLSSNTTLNLSQILDLEILPQDNKHNTRHQEHKTRNRQIPHRLPIRIDHGISLGRSKRIFQLHGQAPIQQGIQRPVPRQGSLERGGEFIRVYRGRDGLTDASPDGGEEPDEGEHRGDGLMGRGGHDGHLLADDEGAAAEGDEDLTHDHIANAERRLAEVDHEADAEEFEAEHGQGEPLEAAGDADDGREDDGPEARADAVDVGHVAGVGDGEAVHGLQVGVEVGVPEVEGGEEEGGQAAGRHDGAVGEEFEGNEGARGEVLFVEREEDHAEAADDPEGDAEGGGVAFVLVGFEGEGEQEEDEASADEEDAGDCFDVNVVCYGLRHEGRRVSWAYHQIPKSSKRRIERMRVHFLPSSANQRRELSSGFPTGRIGWGG